MRPDIRDVLLVLSLIGVLLAFASVTGLAMSRAGTPSTMGGQSLSPVQMASTNTMSPCHDLNNNSYGWTQHYACVQVHLYKQDHDLSIFPTDATKTRQAAKNGKSANTIENWLFRYYRTQQYANWWMPSKKQIQQNPKLKLYPLTKKTVHKYETTQSISVFPKDAWAVRFEATHGASVNHLRMALLNYYAVRWDQGWRPTSGSSSSTTTTNNSTAAGAAPGGSSNGGDTQTAGGSNSQENSGPNSSSASWYAPYISGIVNAVNQFRGWMGGVQGFINDILIWSLENPVVTGVILVILFVLVILIGIARRMRRTWTAMLALWSRLVRATVWVTDTIGVGTIRRLQVNSFRLRRTLNIYGHATAAVTAWAIRQGFHRADCVLTDYVTNGEPGTWSYIDPPAYENASEAADVAVSKTTYAESKRLLDPLDAPAVLELDEDEPPRPGDDLWYRITASDTPASPETIAKQVEGLPNLTNGLEVIIRATPPAPDTDEKTNAPDGQEEDERRLAIELLIHFLEDGQTSTLDRTKHNRVRQAFGGPDYDVSPVSTTLQRLLCARPYRHCKRLLGNDTPPASTFPWNGERATPTATDGGTRAEEDAPTMAPSERAAAAADIPKRHFREHLKDQFHAVCPESPACYPIGSQGTRRWDFLQRLNVYDETAAEEAPPMEAALDALLETDEPAVLRAQVTPAGDLSDLVRQKVEVIEGEESTQFDKRTNRRGRSRATPSSGENTTEEQRAAARERESGRVRGEVASAEGTRNEELEKKGATRSFMVTMDVYTQPTPFLNDAIEQTGGGTVGTPSTDESVPSTPPRSVSGIDESSTSDTAGDGGVITDDTPAPEGNEASREPPLTDTAVEILASRGDTLRITPSTLTEAAATQRTAARDDAWRLAKTWATAADGEFNKLTKPPENSRLAKWVRNFGWGRHTLGRLRDAYRFHRAQEYVGRSPTLGLHYSLRRRWPVVVAAADELPSFTALPSTGAVSDDLAAHMERQLSHTAPLSELSPAEDNEIIGNDVNGATIGYAFNRLHARDLSRPVNHRADYMDRSILHQGLPGSGKSVDQANEIVERRKTTNGPIIVYAGPGANVGELAVRGLLAEFGADWVRDHVNWFDMPEVLPGLTVFDTRPAQEADDSHGNPEAAASVATEEKHPQRPDVASEDTSWETHGSHVMQTVRKIAELLMGESDFQNARVSRDVLQAFGTAGFSPHTYPTGVDGTPAYKHEGGNTSNKTLPTADDLVGGRRQSDDEDDDSSWSRQPTVMPFRWGYDASSHVYPLWQFQEQIQQVTELTKLMDPDVPLNPKGLLANPGSHAVKRNMETPFNNQQHTAQQIIGGVTNRLNALTTDARLAPLFNNTTRRFSFADFLSGDTQNDVLIFDVEDLDPDAQRDFILTHELLMQYELELYKSYLKEEATADDYYVSVFIDEAGRLVEPDELAKMIAVARNHSVSLSLAVQTPDQLFDADSEDSLGDAPTYAEIIGNIQTTVVRAGEITQQQAKALCPAGLEVEDFMDHVRDLPVDHRLVQYPTPSEGTRSQTIEIARIPLPKWHQNADEPPEGYNSREDFEEAFQEVRTDVIDRTNEQYGIPPEESESAVRNRAILNVPELAHHLTIDDPLLPVILAWATWLVARDPPEDPAKEIQTTVADSDSNHSLPDSQDEPTAISPAETPEREADETTTPADRDVREAHQPDEDATGKRTTDSTPTSHAIHSGPSDIDPMESLFDSPGEVRDSWKEMREKLDQSTTERETPPSHERERTPSSTATASNVNARTASGLRDALKGGMTPGEWEELSELLEKGKAFSPREWAIHTDLPTYGEDDQSMQARALNSRVANLLNQGLITEDEISRLQELVDLARDTGNWPPSTVQARLDTDTDEPATGEEPTEQREAAMSIGGVSAAIERRRTSDGDIAGSDPFDGKEPRPGTYRWVRLDEMYRRLRLEVEKILSAEGLDEGERTHRRSALPSLKACADEIEALGTVMTHRGVAGDSPIPETDGIFEIELAKHRDDIPGDDGYAVRLTPEGARLLLENVLSTGWVATAGTDTHDTGLRDAVTALEEAAPTRVSGKIIDQDTGGIPDAELTVLAEDPTECFPDDIISCTVEEETEPRRRPTKKLRNLRKALNTTTKSGECRLPIFVAETPWDDDVGGPDLGPANALSNIIRDPMNTQWSGRRFYSQSNTPIEFDGGARDGGVTAVVPRPNAEDAGASIWVRDPDPDSDDCLLVEPTADNIGHPTDDEIQLRIAPDEFNRLSPSDIPYRATCPPGGANESARYIVETPGSEQTYKYETEEHFLEEWTRVNQPFVPDIEFRYPDYPETAFAILVRYEPAHQNADLPARIAWFDHRMSTGDEVGVLRPIEELIDAIQIGELQPASAGPGAAPETADGGESAVEDPLAPEGAEEDADEDAEASSAAEPATTTTEETDLEEDEGEEDTSSDDDQSTDADAPEETEADVDVAPEAPEDGGRAATAAFVESHLRPESNNLVDLQVAYDRCREYAVTHNLVPPESEDDFEEVLGTLFEAFDTDTGLDGDLFDLDQEVRDTLDSGLQVFTTTEGSEDTSRTVLIHMKLVDPADEDRSFLTNAPPEKAAGAAAYVSSHLEPDPDGKLATTDTYDHYADTVTRWDFEPLNDRGRGVTFPRAVQVWAAANLGVAVKRKRRRIDGEPTQCYLNISRADDTE